VGNVDEASRQLVQCTYECLEKAISIGMCHFFILSVRSVELMFEFSMCYHTLADVMLCLYKFSPRKLYRFLILRIIANLECSN
jgi:hypothetical protein